MKRLIAQRDEARDVGLSKIASNLDTQISVNPTRDDKEEYVYDYNDLRKDVEASLWDAAVRAQDFYGKVADARDIQDLIESQADEFVSCIKNATASKLGAYESAVPGEEATAIEVTEE